MQLTSDKCGIRTDLVRAGDNWHDWGLNEQIEQIRKWTEKTLLRDLKEQTDHSRNQIEESISCRHIQKQKQENASIVKAKIENQLPAPEFKKMPALRI